VNNSISRIDGREAGHLRPVTIIPDYAPAATGSVLIRMGGTQVICGVTVEEAVPRWMREQKVPGGWITAEYSMLPYSTVERSRREVAAGKPSGRTQEIQRLIGRSLRSVVNLEKLGARTLWIDCDVLQADGGTRTAAITGSYVALCRAISRLQRENLLVDSPICEQVAAVSVGMVSRQPVLDLCYREDVSADVDMNVVMTSAGEFVEVQGTAEAAPFSRDQLDAMLRLAEKGIRELFLLQQAALA
jgi:ribonuclease PH